MSLQHFLCEGCSERKHGAGMPEGVLSCLPTNKEPKASSSPLPETLSPCHPLGRPTLPCSCCRTQLPGHPSAISIRPPISHIYGPKHSKHTTCAPHPLLCRVRAAPGRIGRWARAAASAAPCLGVGSLPAAMYQGRARQGATTPQSVAADTQPKRLGNGHVQCCAPLAQE